MHRLLVLVCILCEASAQPRVPDGRAFETLQLIPKAQADLIAVIDGRGGAPLPEEWTIVVHDPEGPSGVREYIIGGTEIVAQRAVSHLASSLTAADALGLENIKVFPPHLAEAARLYGETNGLALGALDYQLRKEGADGAPFWTVTCRDEAGAPLGVLVIAAADGAVISHEGFSQAPSMSALQAAFSEADAEFLESDDARTSNTPRSTRKRSSSKRNSRTAKANPIARSFRKVGGTLQKFFTGRDTISR